MDTARLEAMIEMIEEQGFAYHSVVVVRNGYIVFEEYLNGWSQDSPHHLQSSTKSVTSLLIGTLVQNGMLESLDRKMVDLFADYEIANLDSRKEAINLEHLLTMSDGMEWHELDYPYTDPNNSLGQMWKSPDAVQHVLDTPMRQDPGESWSYNSGTSILLGGVIEEVTGRDVLDYAREVLFDPLGIERIRWDQTTGGHYHTDGGLYLTPRDMARIGYLMLTDGEWNGEQIVSRDWVEASSTAHYSTGFLDYGYQWWVYPGGVYGATGHYEQKIFVIPAAEMVVVFTGYLPDDELHPTDGLVYSYILEACNDLPDELHRQTYTGYGITFEYPTGSSLQEFPFPGEDEISNRSGMFQMTFTSYPFEIMNINWTKTEPDPDLDEYLDLLFAVLRQGSGPDLWTGDTWRGSIGEHDAVFQFFDLINQGMEFRGLAGVWYCDQSDRGFASFYVTNPGISNADLVNRAQQLIDGLECH